MAEKKTRKQKPPQVPQTRWKVRVLKPYPDKAPRIIEGLKIYDRQIISLPGDQKYLDGLDKAGYKYEMRSN